MSTILQAQQKSKQEQAEGPARLIQQNSQGLFWKVMLSVSIAMIITLLSILIYLQLNPRIEVVPAAVQPQEQPIPTKHAPVKVTFETQALTIIPPEPVKKVTQTPTVATTVQTIKPKPNKEQAPISSDKQTPQEMANNVSESESTEDKLSAEALKRRFDLAVLMSDIESKTLKNSETNADKKPGDGSDIHQMSSRFQSQVPLIRYDSHMYSSIADDRWIRINGEVLKEGDVDSTGEIELLEIQPQRSIFRVGMQSFSLESLADWKGY